MKVEVTKNKNDIKDYILKRMDNYKENIIVKENNLIEIDFSLNTKNFKLKLAEILTHVIKQYYMPSHIKKIIKDQYHFLTNTEKEQVYFLVIEKIDLPEKKDLLENIIFNYIDANDSINIDGFSKFRLNRYIDELKKVIEDSFEAFITEKEYDEFIKLLKYFVDIQDCAIDTVNIIPHSGKYDILDCNMKDIEIEVAENIQQEMNDGVVNYDDLLISTLITIAPKNIILHKVEEFKNQELLKTIKAVFEDKVKKCLGCNLCNK